MRIAVLLFCLALVPACGDESPTAPTPDFGSRTGVWAGPISDSINSSGAMRAEITELQIDSARGLIGGVWATTFADASRNTTGSLGGFVSGSELSITATPSTSAPCSPAGPFPPGSYSVTATVSASEITGTYRFYACSTSASGTIALRRQ